MPDFLDSIEVVLVETSPVLAAMQKERLRSCGLAVRWAQSMADIEHDRPHFTIANEFLDALPIRQFVMTEKGWSERMVGVDESGRLAFVLSPAAWNFAVPPERGHATTGAVYEFSAAANALVEDIAGGIARTGGAALFIDYGYAGAGFGETLQAVGDNRYQDILAAPGEVDLSAHVDFGAVAHAARAGGARPYGPLAQGEFLEALGIRVREASLASDGGASPAIDRLTKPDGMGTLFKALAVLPPSAPSPPGFA
jgi:SAM-dependent MidA family methyltransferase